MSAPTLILDGLGLDVLELILGHLTSAELVRRARRVNSTWAALATSSLLWEPRSAALLAAHAQAQPPERVSGESEASYYFRALRHFDLQEVLHPWRARAYHHLRRLGDVSGEGTAAAHFDAHGPVELPQPLIVVYELLRLLAPAAKAKRADLNLMVATALGDPSKERAVRRLPPRLAAAKRDAPLLALLRESWPAEATAAASSSAPAHVAAPRHFVVRLRGEVRARQVAEGANAALEVENALLREENVELRAVNAAQAAELERAHERIDELSLEAREVKRLRARLEQLGTVAMDGQVSEVRRLRARLQVQEHVEAKVQARVKKLKREREAADARAAAETAARVEAEWHGKAAAAEATETGKRRAAALEQAAQAARAEAARAKGQCTMQRQAATKRQAATMATLGRERGKVDAARAALSAATEAAARRAAESEAQVQAARADAARSYKQFKRKFIAEETQPVEPGETLVIGRASFQRVVKPKEGKGTDVVSIRTKRRRTGAIEYAREFVAGGAEHVEAQRADEVRPRTSPRPTLLHL